MDAIHWAGVDRLLNPFRGVAVLANGSRASVAGLNNESVGRNVCAVAAADADGLINPNGLITKLTAEQGLTSIGDRTGLGRSGKCLGWICGIQASQRVTTNSMAPSARSVCSAT